MKTTKTSTHFTAGPWKVNANIQGRLYVEKTPGLCAEIQSFDEGVITSEDRANAHLIAAAPDLFEALKQTLGWLVENEPRTKPLENHNAWWFACQSARAAIAKT